jgi:hypothetical protein
MTRRFPAARPASHRRLAAVGRRLSNRPQQLREVNVYRGDTWEDGRSLTDHPTRHQRFPGAGAHDGPSHLSRPNTLYQ